MTIFISLLQIATCIMIILTTYYMSKIIKHTTGFKICMVYAYGCCPVIIVVNAYIIMISL